METLVKSDEQRAVEHKRAQRLSRIRHRLMPFIGILTFLLVWQILATVLNVPTYLLPKPTEVLQSIIANFPSLTRNGWITTYEMIFGYLMAVFIAVPLAIAITSSATFDRLILPILLFFQTVPKIAIAPLFLIWFGVGTTPKVMVAFLMSFFPIIIDTSIGLRSISPEMVDLARSMGASNGQIFMRFRLPTSLPYLFSGLKVAATLAVVGAVVGEFVGADRGLGYLLLVANSNLQTALNFATIVALTSIGLVLFYIIEMLETLLIPWHVSRRLSTEHGTM
jgi:NitT/TauT family transport system permease protein